MKNILLLGAGLSSSSLIRYLLKNAEKENWHIRIVDRDKESIERKINGSNYAEALVLNALNPEERRPEIEKADLVISMLPARFHVEVAEDCIDLKTNMLTPSYISNEMKALDEKAKEAGILIMNEMGVDPGIDHMSAMRVIHKIKSKGGKMEAFKSFTGGLVAPESDDNPWNYKFTWNPRNVVVAGQGTAASFIQNGQYKYIPYHRLFRRTEIIPVEGYGRFEGYPNRDSLKYREIYGLTNIPTIYRGTLRRIGFSRAWDIFVQLGATADDYVVEGSENMTYREFFNSFLPYNQHDSVELKFRYYMRIPLDDSLWDKLVWLGIFDNEKKIGLKNATPAQILQKLLEEKWTLAPNDKDMLVMYHNFLYRVDGELKEISSEMVSIGEDQTYTSMSNTVGLPVGICAKNILNQTLNMTGVHMPILPEIYNPILEELETHDIRFIEKDISPAGVGTDHEIWRQ